MEYCRIPPKRGKIRCNVSDFTKKTNADFSYFRGYRKIRLIGDGRNSKYRILEVNIFIFTVFQTVLF